MPRFPNKEADIVALARAMADGLQANPAIYPNPPCQLFGPNGLNRKITKYNDSRGVLINARAVAEQAVADKDDTLQNLIDAMKADLRYAENTVDFDDDKLKLIGWAAKKTPTALPSPGQSRLLEAPKQGESGGGWVFLDWKQPADGGKPAAYKVQRRVRDSGDWNDIATAILSEITLVDQPEKTELEYRVIAVNKAGEGTPSNTVMVVL